MEGSRSKRNPDEPNAPDKTDPDQHPPECQTIGSNADSFSVPIDRRLLAARRDQSICDRTLYGIVCQEDR